ncbi:MAG: Uncharacterised protein [Flavobacterium sp. SCGC AAA160-P02]|nr:MAG: Uncharacterised protein [Flavobacterium sp. SCGC AAA160-P02]
MHKKLAADLTSLAHSILQMKNKEDVFALKTKAYEVYEKLAVLAYVEEYINTTPNAEHTKEELVALIKDASKEIEKEVVVQEVDDSTEEVAINIENQEELNKDDIVDELEDKDTIKSLEKELMDTEVQSKEKEDLFSKIDESSDGVVDSKEEIQPTLEEELKDTVSADIVADLFENATKKSLNDKLQSDIQIGLNDRIAFVKNLFGESQEDFNRVVSQLNSFKTEKEAKKFINKVVKPDYDWTDKEEIVERFMSIVKRKFA